MNIFKKLFGRKKSEEAKGEINRYFRTGIFNKFVSVLVTVCFVISIMNLPAFAKSAAEIQKEIEEAKKGTTAVTPAGKSMGSVSSFYSGLEASKIGSLKKGDNYVASYEIEKDENGKAVDFQVYSTADDLGKQGLSEGQKKSFNNTRKQDMINDVYANGDKSNFTSELIDLISKNLASGKYKPTITIEKNDDVLGVSNNEQTNIASTTPASVSGQESQSITIGLPSDKNKEEQEKVNEPKTDNNIAEPNKVAENKQEGNVISSAVIGEYKPEQQSTDKENQKENIAEKPNTTNTTNVANAENSNTNNNDNVLNNQTNNNQISPTQNATNGVVQIVNETQKGVMGFVSPLVNTAISVVSGDNNHLDLPTELKNSKVNVINGTKIIGNVKDTKTIKLTSGKLVTEKSNKNTKKVTKAQAISNSAKTVNDRIKKLSSKEGTVKLDGKSSEKVTKGKNTTTRKTTESYTTKSGNKVSVEATHKSTKKAKGVKEFEYNRTKIVKDSKGNVKGTTKTSRKLTVDKNGKVKGTETVKVYDKNGKLVKTITRKISGTRKVIKDKKGNKRVVYKLSITGTQKEKKNGKWVETKLKKETRTVVNTYKKVGKKIYRTHSRISTIAGKTTRISTSETIENGKKTLRRTVERNGKVTRFTEEGTYKEGTAKKTSESSSSKSSSSIDNKIKDKYGKEGLEAINKISKQTGIDKNTIYKEFVKAKVSKDKFKKASAILLSQMSKGAKIINCSAEALSNLVKKASKALLAIQQLAVDIASGAFFKNNKKGSNKIQTSMSTQKKILNQYGIKADGYSISLNNLKSSLKPGESAIIHVNGNHFITVSKNKDGSFTVKDNKVKNGKAVKYSDAEFTKVMKNKYKVTGKVNVLTSSKSVAKKGTKLSEKKMKSIAGADHYVTETYTVNVPYTVMETRSKQVSYNYTGNDGKVHTATKTVYYKVPVKKTKQVKKTRKKLVKDNKDNKSDLAKQKALELAKKKAEEAKKRAEALAAKRKAEEARKKAELAKKNNSKDYAKLEKQAKEAERKRIAAEKALKAAEDRTKKVQNEYNKAKKEVQERANKTITKKNKDGSSSVISYDANGEMKSSVNYDKSGKKTSETTVDILGNTTTTEYAKDGKTKTAQHVTNATTGETVTTNYAKDGKTKIKETVNDKDGNLKSTVEYRENGTKLNETTIDKNGDIKTTEYAENGKKTKEIINDKNGNLKSEVGYREDGTKANETIVDKNGDMKITEYAQDGITKIKETINDKDGNLKSAVEYQKDGVTKKSETTVDKDGNINTTNYNEQGKKIGSTQSSVDANGNIITTEFDANGKKTGSTITATDEQGNTTTVIFDANDNKLGASVTVKNEDGTTTTVNFDANDKEISSQTLNAQGKLINETETLENGKIRSTDYDENGKVIGSNEIEKNADGTLSITSYDENNKKVEEAVTDENGNVLSVENKADTSLIDTLAGIGKKFGVDSKAISNVFKTIGVSDEQLSQVSSLISEQLSKGAQIVNCAAKATSEALSAVTKPNEFLIGIAQLAVDIVSGDYAKKNTNADGSAKDQIFTTGNAMETVQNMFGLGSQWLSTKVNDLVSNLKENENTNIHVDGNHFITATKNKDGSIAVKDPNVNDGKAVNYTEDEFKKLISNQQAKGIDAETGKALTHKGYNATDENGKVNVLTESKTVAEKGTKLTETQKKDISGAWSLWGAVSSAWNRHVVRPVQRAYTRYVAPHVNRVRSWARKTYRRYVAPHVNRVKKWVGSVKKKVGGFVNSAKKAVGGFINSARNAVGGLINSARSAVGGFINSARSAIGGALSSVTSALGGAGNWLKGAVGNTVSWLQGAWGNTVTFFSDLYTAGANQVGRMKVYFGLWSGKDPAKLIMDNPGALDAMSDEETADIIGDHYGGDPDAFYDACIAANGGNPLNEDQFAEFQKAVGKAKDYYDTALSEGKTPDGVKLTDKQISFYQDQLDKFNNSYNKNEKIQKNINDAHNNGYSVTGIDINGTVITDHELTASEVEQLGLDPSKTYYETYTVNVDESCLNNPTGNLTYKSSSGVTESGLCTVTGDNGSYKIAGVSGTYSYQDADGENQTINVAYEYQFNRNSDGTISKGTTNAYLLDNQTSVSQRKPDNSGGGSSGAGAGGGLPTVQTIGIITETGTTVTISGAGSKFTIGSDNSPQILGRGTQALKGSNLYVTTKNKNGNSVSANIVVTKGSYVYNGGWTNTSRGSSYKFDVSSNKKLKAAQNFVDAIVSSSVSSDGSRQIDFSKDIDFNKTFVGNPFSSADVVYSLSTQNVSCTINCLAGDNVGGETLNSNTKVTLEAKFNAEGNIALFYKAAEDGSGNVSKKGFSIDGQTSVVDKFKKGQYLGFEAYLERTKSVAVNTITINGVNEGEYYRPGELKVTGKDGCLVLAEEIGLSKTETKDENGNPITTFTKNSKGKNSAFYWDGDGNTIVHLIEGENGYSCYLTGDIHVNDAYVALPPSGDGEGGGDGQNSGKTMNFEGKRDANGNLTGVFHNCDNRMPLTEQAFGAAIFAAGSKLKAGSVMGDGQKIENNITIGKNGEWKIDNTDWFNVVDWKKEGLSGLTHLVNWGNVGNWAKFTAGQVYAGLEYVNYAVLKVANTIVGACGVELYSGKEFSQWEHNITRHAYGYDFANTIAGNQKAAEAATNVGVVTAVVVVTAIFVIATAGTGIGILAAEEGILAAVAGNLTSISASTIASAATTSYFTASAAVGAIEAYNRGDMAGVALNIVAGLLAFFCPFKVGGLGAGAAEGTITSSTGMLSRVSTNITTRITDISSKYANVFSREAWKAGIKNGLSGVSRNFKNLMGANGIEGFLGAMNELSQNMWVMTKLQIAMNAVGQLLAPAKALLNSLGANINDNTAQGKLYNFIFGEMELQAQYSNNIFAIDPGQSLQFGVIMYVGMPFFQGLVGSLGNTAPIAENGVGKTGTNSLSGFIRNEAKEIVTGMYEEQVKENIIQYGLTGMGVSPEWAEVLSEFLSPDGAGQFNSETFAKNIISNTKTSNAKTINYQMNTAMAQTGSSVQYVEGATEEGKGTYSYRGNSGVQDNTRTVTVENNLQLQNAQLASIITAKNGGTARDFYNTYNALNSFAASEQISANEDGYTAEQAATMMFVLEGLDISGINNGITDITNEIKLIDQQITNLQNMNELPGNIQDVQQRQEKIKELEERKQTIQEDFNEQFAKNFAEQAGSMYQIASANNNFNIGFRRQFVKGITSDISQNSRVQLLQTISQFKDKYLDGDTGKINQQKLIDAINTNQEGALEDFYELSMLSFMTADVDVDFGFNVEEVIAGIDMKNIRNEIREIEQKTEDIISSVGISVEQKQEQIEDLLIQKQQKLDIVNTLSNIAVLSAQIENSKATGNIWLGAIRKTSGYPYLMSSINVQGIVDATIGKINELDLSEEEVNSLSSETFWNLVALQKSSSSNVKFNGDLGEVIDNFNSEVATTENTLNNSKSLEKQKAEIEEQLKSLTGDDIANNELREYLNNKLNNIKRNIIANNRGKFSIVTSASKKGYEIVKGDRNFEIWVNGDNYGTFDILALYEMGVISNSDFNFEYRDNKLQITIENTDIIMDVMDINSLLMNEQFKDLLVKNLDNNEIIQNAVREKYSQYSYEFIKKELNQVGIEVTNNEEIDRDNFINRMTDLYKANLSIFFNEYSNILLGSANSDDLKFIKADTIENSKGLDYSQDAGHDTYVSIPDSLALLQGMENRLDMESIELNYEQIKKLIDAGNINGETTILINGEVVKLDSFSDFVGFGADYEGLMFRLLALAEYQKNGAINKAKQMEKANANWLAKYRSNHGIKEGKKLKPGALDEYREYLQNDEETKEYSEEDKLLAVRLFANQMVKESGIFGGAGLRASQMELLSALLRDANVALDMGGGKTVSLVTDAIVDRILMGTNANFEILVGNGAIGNYVGTDMQKLLQFVGMDMVAITDYKTNSGVDADGLLAAYNNPDIVMIMDPTTRGHLKNDAANGGETGMKINAALNSVRRVVTDEIHLWTLTQTAAVISNGSRATSDENINSAVNMYNKLNVKEILSENNFNTIINYGDSVSINSEYGKFGVKKFRTFSDWIEYKNDHSNESIMAIIGESSADVQVVFNGDIKTKLEADGSINNAELVSFVRGLFTASDMGGADFGEDGTVKPVSTKIEEDMVIGDIFFQMGYAANAWALNKKQASKYNNIEDFIKAATRESDTSMQTSLTAIYDGADDLLALVGVSGTVLGLEQLIINRTGSNEVYMVSGGRAKIQEQSIQTYDSTKDGYKGVLIQQVQNQIRKTVVENAKLLANGEQLTDILMLAKVAPSIEIFMEAIKTLDTETLRMLEEQGFVIFDRTTDTKYEIKDGKLIKSEYEQHYEDGELKTDEANRDQTAKDKNIRKIIIDNDAGATGTDYQGNYKLMVLDAHMYSNTDLAQLLQRIGRPDPRGSGRGKAERIIFQDVSAINLKMEDYIANNDFAEYFENIINDKTEGNFFQNERAAELFSNLIIKEDGVYKIRPFIDFATSITAEQYQKDLLELTTFMTEVSNINSSIRFAVSDAIRDRMILKPLRTMLAQAQTPEEKAIIRKALDDVLKKGEYDANTALGGREAAQDLDSDTGMAYIEKTIANISQEATSVFESLRANLASNSMAYMATTLNLAEIEALDLDDIQSAYNEKQKEIDSIKENIKELKSKNTEENQEKIEELENRLANILEVKSMAQMESLEELVESMMLLEPYIAPTLDTEVKMELSTLVEQESMSQETLQVLGVENAEIDVNSESFKEAEKNGLAKVQNGNIYITDLGKVFVKISDDGKLIKALKMILDINDDDISNLDLAKVVVSKNINVEALSELVKSEIGTEENLSMLTADEIKEIINAKHPRGFEETLMKQGIRVPSAVEMKAIELLKDKEGVEISAEKLDVYNRYSKVVDIYNSLMANKYRLSLAERYQLFKESDSLWIQGINSSINLAKTTFGFMMLTPFINVLNQMLGVEEGSRAFVDAVKSTIAIQLSFVAGNKIWNAMGEKVDEKVSNRVDVDLSMTGLLNVIDGKENEMAIKTMIDNWTFKRATDKLNDAVENSLELQNNINTDLTLDKLEGYFDNKSEFVEVKSALKDNGLIIEIGNEEILTNNGKIIANEVLKIQNSATSDNDIKVLESYANSNANNTVNTAASVAGTANTSSAANTASTTKTAKQSTSSNKEVVNTLVQLQDKGVLAKSENEGWTTEAILGIDQMIENKDVDNLIKELKTYTKEGVNISELPVLDSSEIRELEDAADELIRTISNKDSRTDKVKKVATSSARLLTSKIPSRNESRTESVKMKEVEKQIKIKQAQNNFNKVKEQIAQKYEIENNIALAETVRRLDVEDGKVIFKNNVKQVQDVETANVEEQVIEKVKEMDISEEIEFENLMMEYVDSNSNVLVKSLPKIIDILLEKYDIKDTGRKQAVKALIGVTKPEEAQVALKALFAVFDKSDDIAKLFGYTNVDDVVANASKEDIMNKYRDMVNKLSSKEVVNMGYVSLLSMARDVMILLSESEDVKLIAAVKAGDVDNITNKLLVSKAVNMNYIVKKTIEKKDDGDFVIDLNKIKSAVENPNLNKERPEELLKKLADAFDGGIKNSRADIKNALMDLSNIHAIQAAA